MQSESIKNLAEALAKAQAEMPSVPMNSVNPFLKNKFADLGSVINTSRQILAKHGLSISQFPISGEGKVGVLTVLMHTSGEYMGEEISLALSEEKGKSAAQVAGSVITYLRRYSWSAVLGLYADEDTDGNHKVVAPEKKEEHPATVELTEDQKRASVLAAWEKLVKRAQAIRHDLVSMDGGWDSAKMKAHYNEQKAIIEAAEKAK